MTKIKVKQHNTTPLLGKLKLCTELAPFLSDNRVRLLEAIAQHGSLSAAARALPMSYKSAWDALDSMNNLADQQLVIRSAGGRNGGGTQLTDYGHKLISMYKALEIEYQATLEFLQPSLGNSDDADIADFRRLMRRVNFRSSARNQLVGRVAAVTVGAVNVLVELKVSEQITIIAAVTRESASVLNIEFGKEFIALIKSSQMLLHSGEDYKLSASNQLQGTVSHIEVGAVCSDVSVALDDQKSLGVSVTRDSVDTLKLVAGSEVCVSFKASAVILCQYD